MKKIPTLFKRDPDTHLVTPEPNVILPDGASVLLPLTSGELACDLYCRTLIASAPTDIAALIAEVERLRAEVESLESTLMEDY